MVYSGPRRVWGLGFSLLTDNDLQMGAGRYFQSGTRMRLNYNGRAKGAQRPRMVRWLATPALAPGEESAASEQESDRVGLRGEHITGRIGTAKKDFLGTIVEVTHAEIDEYHIIVVKAERIDAGKDGVIGVTGSLAVDGEVVGRLRIEIGD